MVAAKEAADPTTSARTEIPILESERIVKTIEALQQRITERFPESSLRQVCGEALGLAKEASARVAWAQRPHWPLRILPILIGLLIVAGLFATVVRFLRAAETMAIIDAIPVIEAGINDMIFIGIALFFVGSLETRLKRNRLLAAIHELRSVAHVIDMHQLTKDPSRSMDPVARTASSPKRTLSPFELERYLEYCSELLSLVGKVSVLYIQPLDDDSVRDSANEVEILTAGLSRQVWQKLMILHAKLPADGAGRD